MEKYRLIKTLSIIITMFLCSKPVLAAQQIVEEQPAAQGMSVTTVIMYICLAAVIVVGIIGAIVYKKKTGEPLIGKSSRRR